MQDLYKSTIQTNKKEIMFLKKFKILQQMCEQNINFVQD